MYGLNLGMEKKLMNDKLTVGFSVDNLINRFFFGQINYGNAALIMESRWDQKVVNMNIRYSFGQQLSKK